MEDTERRELQKFKINSAAMGGLIIGLIISLLFIAVDVFRENETIVQILGVAEFVVVCYGLYGCTRNYVVKTIDYGTTFGKALSFQMLVAIFASILVGIATYVVMFVMSPDYYITMYKEAYTKIGSNGAMSESLSSAYAISEAYSTLASSPFIFILFAMFGTVIKWFFPAMIISAIINKYFSK